MKGCEEIRFLGDLINKSGNINQNIEDRLNKAIGLRTKVKSLISGISLGSYHFEICMIMREAVYLNSILVNGETWYFMTQRQLEALEAADAAFLQICFITSAKCVRDSYYSEAGITKVMHILAKRRLLFLQNVLNQESNSILK